MSAATARRSARAIAWPRVAAVIGFAVLITPLAAAGQQTVPPPDTQGPMIVERVEENGFSIAPDFKVTKVDKSSARFAGAYGGWVFQHTLLVGGGGYWLTNESSAFKMAYGGAVVEWMIGADRPIGFSARGLFGGGEATLAALPGDVILFDRGRDPRLVDGDRRGTVVTSNDRFAVRQDFVVFEPQADVLLRLSRQWRLNAGAGYRVIGGTRGLDNRLRGVSGSLALQFITDSKRGRTTSRRP